MNPILRNILAVVLGWIIGSTVNFGLVLTGHAVFPIPGVDPSDMDALAAVMPTLEAHFMLFPWLAHALGTLVGAFIAARIAASHKMSFALGIGGFFLLGGIYMITQLSAPLWFIAADLILSYLPMAWLGGTLAIKMSKEA